MRRYREITNDAEVPLILSGCECGGWDITRSFRKEPSGLTELAACLCGLRRGRRRPGGGWSMVIDDATHAPLSVSGAPEGTIPKMTDEMPQEL
jgi:hypothetical protein